MTYLSESLRCQEFSAISSTYLNSAYFGPSPQRSKKYLNEAIRKEFDPSFFPYESWIHRAEDTRDLIAKLLKVSPDRITHSTSSSDNISMLAQHLPLQSQDCVVTFKEEYPSNVLPWLVAAPRRGYQVAQLPLPPVENTVSWLEQHLPKNCKLLNLSQVSFHTGTRYNLIEMSEYLRSKNIFFIVDGTQALGGIAVSPRELAAVDFYTCSTYKWMLGPYGMSFCYISESFQNYLPLRITGNWIVSRGVNDVNELTSYQTDALPGARAYDRGQSPSMLNMAMLQGSLELLCELGLENIEKHNLSLVAYFKSKIDRQHYELITPEGFHGALLAIKSLNQSPFHLIKKFQDNAIDVSVRQSNIRISFHLFNNIQDVDHLLNTMNLS